MPIQFKEEDGGKLLSLYISGKIVKADFQTFVPEFDRLVQQHGKLRVLFDITQFHGWESSAMWEEIKFDAKHYTDIERLAVVGDRKWHHGLATIFKPFTKAIIRYFDRAEYNVGRQWLGAA